MEQTISKWALHRRLYDWVLSFAHSAHATTALFAISFAESSVFPVAPDLLQIALTLEQRSKAWHYAWVSSVASVLGGLAGYAIGYLCWQVVSSFFFSTIFSEDTFLRVSALYHQWDAWVILAAAFTPLPYKVFTIAAGVFHISLPIFILASAIGRSARFFLVATLLSIWGESIKHFIERYFNVISICLFTILLGAFFIFKYI